MTKEALVTLAKGIAVQSQMDPALVCAVVEQESAWDTLALRFEPAFYDKYEKGQLGLSDTERHSRAFSWGLMQVMGQVAREFGLKEKWLSSMLDPIVGVTIGCKVLKAKLATKTSVEGGLLAYNGGSNLLYGKQVLARKVNYAG